MVPFFVAAGESFVVERQHLIGELPKGLQFVPPQVVPIALGEAVDEERRFSSPKEHDAPKPSGLALPPSCDALLDHAAAEVGVDAPALGPAGRVAQRLVGNSVVAREAAERLGLEDAHSAPALSMIPRYITLSHIVNPGAWRQLVAKPNRTL